MGFFDIFTNNEAFSKIDADKAKELIEQGVTLVDVREVVEFNSGHINKAKNYPLGKLTSGKYAHKLDKDRPVIIYCQSGARSRSACKYLSKEGYTEVYDLGGIMAWPFKLVR